MLAQRLAGHNAGSQSQRLDEFKAVSMTSLPGQPPLGSTLRAYPQSNGGSRVLHPAASFVGPLGGGVGDIRD